MLILIIHLWSNLLDSEKVLLLLLFGFKVMVMVVLKKDSVMLPHMMSVLLWFMNKDLLPMVLLLLLVVLVLVMLNLSKLEIMIVALGKT